MTLFNNWANLMRIGVVMRLLARHTATVIMTVTGDVTVSLSTGARFMDLLIDRWTLQLIDSLALVEHRHISISHERAASGNLATYLRVGVVSSRVEGQKSSRLPGCRKMLENRQRGSNRGVNLIWKLGTVWGVKFQQPEARLHRIEGITSLVS